MDQAAVFSDLRSLTSKSLVYGLGTILLRGINFFLIPLYTRFLTPSDYGVMAVTTAITMVLGILYPLSLHGALPYFYFSARSDVERDESSGTIWVGMMTTAAGMTVLFDLVGGSLFPVVFREVPFVPYIRLGIWTAFFNIFGLLPLNLFQIRERPGLYVLTTGVSTLLNVGLVIVLIVFQRQGAYSYLLGMLLAAAMLAGPYLILALRSVRVVLRWNIIKAALVYSLPLVPHAMASWVVELSDRVILERYVPLGELGLYSLSYQVASVMSIVGVAINYAWVPFLFKTHAQKGDAAKADLTRLATYYVLVLVSVALGLALLVKPVFLFLTPPEFHAAHRVAPWIVGGLLLGALYYIPVNFLFLMAKTGWVPLVTAVSGAVNVGLNLWMVPRYGIVAAACSTFLAYGAMLVLAWVLALRVYPFSYEYRRLSILTVTAGGLFAAGSALGFESMILETLARGALWLAFPVVLIFLGFFTAAEKEAARAFVRRVLVIVHRIA